MDRKQPESNPVQEALRPTHLSMRRELNCNRGNPKRAAAALQITQIRHPQSPCRLPAGVPNQSSGAEESPATNRSPHAPRLQALSALQLHGLYRELLRLFRTEDAQAAQ
jgi:hypothetical protein